MPSLLTEARQGDRNGSVSILRDLDTRSARIETARPRVSGRLVSVGVVLLLGGVTLSWLSSTISFDNDETVPQHADAETLPDPASTASGRASVPPVAESGVVNAREIAAGGAPPASPMQALNGGAAVILAPVHEPAPPQAAAQANPLKALTVPAAASPAKRAAEMPPTKTKAAQVPIKAPNKAPISAAGKSVDIPVPSRRDDPEAISSPSGKPPEKIAEPAASQPVVAAKPANQRDVEIITAIVKEK